jgi:hypothetical protein
LRSSKKVFDSKILGDFVINVAITNTLLMFLIR